MSIFSDAIEDIFNVEQFQENFIVSGLTKTCISYQSEQQALYTEFGLDSGRSITITCKVADYTPCKGDQITFRNKTWKVQDFTTDSHNLTHIINLKSKESK